MRYPIFCWLLFLSACGSDSRKSAADLLVTFDRSSLRDAPGEKTAELRLLRTGERLRPTGRVSDFVTPLRLGDTLLQAPWVQVQLANHQTGWVFAAALQPVEGDAAQWFLQQQMTCFFGPGLTGRRNRWVAQRQAPAATEIDFARDYREAVALRDTLMRRLAARAEPNEAGFEPDFFWLAEALPGFVFQMVAEGTQPYAFADYRAWQQISLATSGLQDDRFVDACLLAFAADSIESFFPAWVMQTWDYGGSSQLGTGRHLTMLQTLDAALEAGRLFEAELLTLKDELLDDILDKNTTFWQPLEKAVAELEEILAADLRCLSERDKLALTERRKTFDDPAANGLRFNLRAGE